MYVSLSHLSQNYNRQLFFFFFFFTVTILVDAPLQIFMYAIVQNEIKKKGAKICTLSTFRTDAKLTLFPKGM